MLYKCYIIKAVASSGIPGYSVPNFLLLGFASLWKLKEVDISSPHLPETRA